MRDNLNKNDQGFIADLRHEIKNVEFYNLADLLLPDLLEGSLTRYVGLCERRQTPPSPDSDSQEPDPPRIGPPTGP